MGNKGSSVVEMSLIMPIIFGIVVMVIVLFLDTIRDGLVQQEGYSVIYTYQEGAGLHEQLEEMKNAETRDAGQAVISDGNYRYEKEGHVCITEVDVCSNRLRRCRCMEILFGNKGIYHYMDAKVGTMQELEEHGRMYQVRMLVENELPYILLLP